MLWEVSVVEQRYQAVLEVIRDGASVGRNLPGRPGCGSCGLHSRMRLPSAALRPSFASASAAHPLCVTATGFVDIAIASVVVRRPQ